MYSPYHGNDSESQPGLYQGNNLTDFANFDTSQYLTDESLLFPAGPPGNDGGNQVLPQQSDGGSLPPSSMIGIQSTGWNAVNTVQPDAVVDSRYTEFSPSSGRYGLGPIVGLLVHRFASVDSRLHPGGFHRILYPH
jgi:hypothetical protein